MFTRTFSLLMLTAVICTAGNIVQNPGFESGTANWTLNSDFFLSVPGYPGYFHSGSQSVETPCVDQTTCMDPVNGAFIRQTLTTVPGQRYSLSFWVTENSGPTSEMAVYWAGSLLQDVMNPNNNGGPTGWKQFTWDNLLATTSSTVLQVNARQVPAEIFFDDFFRRRDGGLRRP
jgi:hypothetical protein